MSKINSVLGAFQNGDKLTAKQISARFGLANPADVVYTLRNEGYPIYAKKFTNSKGDVKTKYSLGRPSREVIAAGIQALGIEGAGLV